MLFENDSLHFLSLKRGADLDRFRRERDKTADFQNRTKQAEHFPGVRFKYKHCQSLRFLFFIIEKRFSERGL